MAAENTDVFQILTESETPMAAGTGIHVQSDVAGQLFISGVALRAHIREQFMRLYPFHKLGVAEVFGTLSKSSACRSVFSIESAMAILPDGATLTPRQFVNIDRQTGSAAANKLREALMVPVGTRFVGKLAINAPRGSQEDLAVKTALLSVNHIGPRGYGFGRCSVYIEDENLKKQLLYQTDPSKTVGTYANIWIPDVEAEMVAHFSVNPEKMYHMEPSSLSDFPE